MARHASCAQARPIPETSGTCLRRIYIRPAENLSRSVTPCLAGRAGVKSDDRHPASCFISTIRHAPSLPLTRSVWASRVSRKLSADSFATRYVAGVLLSHMAYRSVAHLPMPNMSRLETKKIFRLIRLLTLALSTAATSTVRAPRCRRCSLVDWLID